VFSWFLFIVGCVLLVTAGVSKCEASPEWVWSNPRPSGNPFNGSARCGDIFVAVGGQGRIVRSTNGVDWIRQESGTVETLLDVECDGSLFIAVGAGGTVLSSIDGAVWSPIDIGVTKDLYGVGWFGQWVVVGVGPTIATSDDGSIWTIRYSEDFNQYLYDVASDGSLLVATGGDWDTSATSIVMYSADNGLSWTTDTFESPLGYGWLNDVTYGNGWFVAVHDDGSAYSSDGTGWVGSLGAADYYSLVGVTWDGTQYVAVGSAGVVTTSPDAVNWSVQTSGSNWALYDVEWTGEEYIAVGHSGTLMTSVDTVNWTAQLPSEGFNDLYFQSVAWNNSTFVATALTPDYEEGVFAVSDNGWDWTLVPATGQVMPYGITWGDGLFVAVSTISDIVKTSSDGLLWNDHLLDPPYSLRDVTWSSEMSKYVAVGHRGTLLTSDDGVTWTEKTSNTSSTLISVSCDSARCIAVGASGAVTMSTDGAAWAAQTISTEHLYDVAHNLTGFVAVGTGGVIFFTADGSTWSPQASGTTVDLRSVGWVGDSFVAGTRAGSILSSADGVTWSSERVADRTTTLSGVCNGYPLVVGLNSAILVRCDTSPDSDGDGLGDLCDPCPSDFDNTCDESQSAAGIVGSGGGSVANEAGTAEVVIPADAVADDVSISITSYDPASTDAGFAVGDGLAPAGEVFDFQPAMTFAEDVSITLTYEQGTMPECGPEETALDVYWWDGLDWVPQGAAQDCAANSLTILTDHFSFFMLGWPTVVIDGCDSGVVDIVVDGGDTISKAIEECGIGVRNHGQFVQCVAHLGNELVSLGLISEAEKDSLQACAARADIP
jgi:hypothetical protein